MAYSKEKKDKIFDKICERIEEGDRLRDILKDKGMPSSQTFFKWIVEDDVKSKQYAHSTNVRADMIFDEMLAIADDGSNDLMTITKGEISYEIENKEVVNRSRLRIDTRKWILSKMNPKKYGDKIDHTTAGEKITNTTHEVIFKDMSQ